MKSRKFTVTEDKGPKLNDLLRAVHAKDEAKARSIIDQGVSPIALSFSGESAILLAAEKGLPTLLRDILDRGWSPDGSMDGKRVATTPLIRAVRANQIECVRLLVEMGANVRLADSGGETALWHAAAYGHDECCEELLKKCHPDESVSEDGSTALIEAANNAYYKVITLLLKAGADPNLKNSRGDTALMWAASEKNGLACVKSLIEAGADPRIRHGSGKSALSYSLMSTDVEIFKYLRSQGLDPRSEPNGLSEMIEEAIKLAAGSHLVELLIERESSEKNSTSSFSWAKKMLSQNDGNELESGLILIGMDMERSGEKDLLLELVKMEKEMSPQKENSSTVFTNILERMEFKEEAKEGLKKKRRAI